MFISLTKSLVIRSKVNETLAFSTFSQVSQVFRPVSETIHFASGSKCPVVKPDGILRLYSMKFCPYAQRTRIVLAAKRIPNEVVNVNLFNKPDWLALKNPLTKVPILEFDGKLVYESLITAEYLEEAYPATCPLNSSDPYQRARDRIYVELFGKVTRGMFKLYRANKDDETTWRIPIASIERGLSWFEEELSKRGSTFFGGDKPGMLDYMIWPWFERMPMLPIVSQGVISVAINKFPKLINWIEDMKEDEAVKESYISAENHAKYLKGHLAGNPDYDMKLV